MFDHQVFYSPTCTCTSSDSQRTDSADHIRPFHVHVTGQTLTQTLHLISLGHSACGGGSFYFRPANK